MVSEGRVCDVLAKTEKGRLALEAFVPYCSVPASLAQVRPISKEKSLELSLSGFLIFTPFSFQE